MRLHDTLSPLALSVALAFAGPALAQDAVADDPAQETVEAVERTSHNAAL